MMNKKKLFLSMASIIIAIILMAIPNKVKASTNLSPAVYFGIREYREGTKDPNNIAYAINNPKANGSSASSIVGAYIWQIAKYNNSTGTGSYTTGNYYCIRGGQGFSDTNKVATYNISYDFKNEKSTIASSTNNTQLKNLVNSDNYYRLLALADLLYLPGVSTSAEREALLTNVGIDDYYKEFEEDDKGKYYAITDADIEAVQQAAIWYFTNSDQNVYNSHYQSDHAYIDDFTDTGAPNPWLFYKTSSMSSYTSLSDYSLSQKAGLQRQKQAEYLYNYLIKTAIEKSSSYKNGTAVSKTKITLYTNQTVANTQPIVLLERTPETPGNYKLTLVKKDGNGTQLNQAVTFTVNGVNKSFSNGQLEIANEQINASNYTKTDTYVIQETVAPNGYEKFDGIITVTVTKQFVDSVYGIKNYNYTVTDAQGKVLTNNKVDVSFDSNTNNITVGVKNSQNNGAYNVVLVKKDQDNKTINDKSAKFKINNVEKEFTGTYTIASNVAINASNVNTPDVYEIEEIEAPDGYEKFDGKIKVTVTKKNENGNFGINQILPEITGTSSSLVDVSESNGTIYINVKNYKNEEGKYNLVLIKTNEDGNQISGEAKFNINGTQTTIDGSATIASEVEITTENLSQPDVYTIKEVQAPNGYIKFDGTITLQVRKKIDNGKLVIDEPLLTVLDADGQDITNSPTCPVSYEKVSSIIHLRVKNTQQEGKYNLVLVKEDKNGKDLKSTAVFEVNGQRKEVRGTLVVAENVEITSANVNSADVYTIKELEPPDKYCKFDGIITVTVEKEYADGTYKAKQPIRKVEDAQGNDITNQVGDDVKVHLNEDGNIYVEVVNYEFDLKLVKRIVEVNGQKVPERIDGVDITKLANGTATTADYDLNKDPVAVQYGDIVKYTLRVYNEGQIDGYATEITEDIPKGLEFIWSDKTGDELENDSSLSALEKEAISYNQLIWSFKNVNTSTNKVELISTDYLAKGQGVEKTASGSNLIKAFDPSKEYKNTVNDKNPDYKEVSVYMKVVAEDMPNSIIRNEAAVTDDTDGDGNPVNDRDSKPEEWVKYEDDEDYDNLILKSFDLSLRKFIIAVSKDDKIEDSEYLKNTNGSYKRAPQVDTSKLNTIGEDGNMITTAIYNHTKQPLQVSKKDIIVYMLRVYNEGDIAGYATEITDHLPSYLKYVDSEFNKQYGWTASEDGKTVKTKYLQNSKIDAAVYKDNSYILSYKEVPIMCQLTDDAHGKVTNIADITEFKDENKKDITDRDSQADNVDAKEGNKPEYKDDEMDKDYIPGQQDDDDFEKVIVLEFDLALRKFITGVNNTSVTSRIPQVKYDKNSNKITYEHTKDPVDVVSGDIVTYTIRVFNEGEMNGYASEVTDDIPDGLEFLPDNSLNKEYRWIMYDSEGKQTTDVSKATKITTDYLSKKQGEARGKENEENPALLKAFDKESEISDKNPDYKDVRIAFKVTEPNSSARIIVNSAQISDDTDEEGNPVDDIDSTPDKWIDGEDDQDREYIKLTEFDLALRKWVTHAIVIENGKETVTQTGHKAEDDPEDVVKVELHRKKLSSVQVKFKYSIRVTNEGDIAGYAKEITDYVPQGLKFESADNPDWKDEGNNVISTRKLENTLLQPGESAEVTVTLTWINGTDTLGLKTNIAEISEDYNDKGVPDKDSTPDNKKSGEDDIDDAPVLLSISTGGIKIAFTIILGTLMVVAGGIVLTKKHII